jgi:hypothetical protein
VPGITCAIGFSGELGLLALRNSLLISLLAGNLDWRLVRSGLPRQPASPGSRDFRYNLAKRPAVCGLIASGDESLCPEFDNSLGHCAENLCASSAMLPFSRETGRRPGLIPLRGGCQFFQQRADYKLVRSSAKSRHSSRYAACPFCARNGHSCHPYFASAQAADSLSNEPMQQYSQMPGS